MEEEEDTLKCENCNKVLKGIDVVYYPTFYDGIPLPYCSLNCLVKKDPYIAEDIDNVEHVELDVVLARNYDTMYEEWYAPIEYDDDIDWHIGEDLWDNDNE